MDVIPTQRIRNVVLVGHNGCGKTTLVEALLHRAGVTTRIGRVEDGTTVTSTDPEEVKRGMSLSLGIAPFEWRATDGETYKINLLDAPGYADFVGEEMAAMSVADLAIVVVSAVDGIEVGTELAWERCVANNIPRLVFVNKDDKPRANFHAVLAALQAKWGHGFVPLELPLGEEEALHGVADVLSDQAFEYDPDGRHHTAPFPPRSSRKSTVCTTSWSKRSSPATTTNSSATCRATYPPQQSWSAPSPTRYSSASSSRSSSARRSPVSASTAWPTSSARSGPARPTDRRR